MKPSDMKSCPLDSPYRGHRNWVITRIYNDFRDIVWIALNEDTPTPTVRPSRDGIRIGIEAVRQLNEHVVTRKINRLIDLFNCPLNGAKCSVRCIRQASISIIAIGSNVQRQILIEYSYGHDFARSF